MVFKWGMKWRVVGNGLNLGKASGGGGGCPISSAEEMPDELVRSRGLFCFLFFKINIKEKWDKRKRANDGMLCWRGWIDWYTKHWSTGAWGSRHSLLLIARIKVFVMSRAQCKWVSRFHGAVENSSVQRSSGLGPKWEGPWFSRHSSREAFCLLPPSPSSPLPHLQGCTVSYHLSSLPEQLLHSELVQFHREAFVKHSLACKIFFHPIKFSQAFWHCQVPQWLGLNNCDLQLPEDV